MIDGTKIRIHGADAHEQLRMQRRLRSHRLLKDSWRSRGEGKAGEQRHTAKWNGWTFTADATRCWEVRGSFHKAHHGGTNWQDYTFTQFRETVAALCDAFGLHDAGLTLAGLEIGVNIVPPMPTAEVLRSIVLHKNAHPVAMAQGHGIEIVHAGYRFKVYNKAAQYPQHVTGELLRVEVKANKMRTLHPVLGKGATVADLLNPAAWTRLRAFLLSKFDELLIVEPTVRTDGLRPAQRDLVVKAANPSYWHTMPRQRRSERRRTLDALFTHYASPNLKANLRTLIAAKLEELNAEAPAIMPAPFTRDVCTKGTTPRQGTPPRPKPDVCTTCDKGCKCPGYPSRRGCRRGSHRDAQTTRPKVPCLRP